MAGFTAVIDSTAEDADNVQLNISDGVAYRLMSLDLPEPKVKALYTGSFDTEGQLPASEHGYENREITIGLRVYGTSASNLLTNLGYLKQKEGKCNREGATLRVTLPSGDIITFDLLEASGVEALHNSFAANFRTEGELRFVARPFWRGVEQTFGAVSETTLPVVIWNVTGIKGDVPAIGRLVITDLSGQDQWWVTGGIQSRHYDAAATAALFFEAETRTALGGAATAVGAAGASGAGSNVMRQGSLIPRLQPMLSTQLNGGQHMSHVGSFEVLARVYLPTTNAGAVTIVWEWAAGDFRKRTTNDPVEFDAGHALKGKFLLLNLGQVHVPAVSQGVQRWEGRILASSTIAGDDLDVDWIGLRPLTEGAFTLSAVQRFENPSVLARDEFDQTAGALTGKTLPAGGTWVGAGDADDFSVETTGKTAQRTAVSDAGSLPDQGRVVVAGTTNYAAVVVQVDFKASVLDISSPSSGVMARRVDANNHLIAYAYYSSSTGLATIQLDKVVASTRTPLGFATLPISASTWTTLRLVVDAAGHAFVWALTTGGVASTPLISAYDSVLATGGTLATGKAGFFDVMPYPSPANTRNYDNFFVGAPSADAAIFASQSAELTHQTAEREDSSGAIWSPVSNVEGDYFRLLPAGREGRENRLFIKACRGDPQVVGDPAIDDLQVQVFATPRGVSIPTP